MRLDGTGIAAIALCIPQVAYAQDVNSTDRTNEPVGPIVAADADDATDQADEDTGEIVVTGSRAALNGFSAPSPTLVIGRETIDQQSAATIAQVLYQEPAFRA